ncbi:MAG: hypothetical protein BGO39_28125 [Chloroflexi bacterium 54-19]|nr:MAG: hypothetical protein BGO39_28125 [Chloroflexi bacterium 54-19]
MAMKILLIGYNGANNTGSEARLLSIIEDIKAVTGPDIKLTVPTLDRANTLHYIAETPNLRVVPFAPVFFKDYRRLVKEHDLVILVEGSCYMDSWTNFLLWAWLWASHCAHVMGKLCLAYAVDAGEVSFLNRWLVRHEANRTSMITTRTQAAADLLKKWGVTSPLEVTADPAFSYQPDQRYSGWLRQAWPETAHGLVGLAVENIYVWPVVLRPWGRRENCYRWPYYFSHSSQRRQAGEKLAQDLANLADYIIEKYNRPIALIGMEQLDAGFARRVQAKMANPGRARIFASPEYNASHMTYLLRSLDLLVTSRYHAGVLSLAAQVPQLALGHDLRLKTLHQELGLGTEFFVEAQAPGRGQILQEKAGRLLTQPGRVKPLLAKAYREQLNRARLNQTILREFLQGRGWEVAA